VVDYGTHGVFFGVVTSSLTIGSVEPLIYVDGRYLALSGSADL
jgi:hypothetical protein